MGDEWEDSVAADAEDDKTDDVNVVVESSESTAIRRSNERPTFA